MLLMGRIKRKHIDMIYSRSQNQWKDKENILWKLVLELVETRQPYFFQFTIVP